MKILVTGGLGQLGWDCREVFGPKHEVLALDLPNLDITDPDSVDGILNLWKPDVLVNCAAYTAVDRAETDVAKSWHVNRDGPALLASRAKAHGIFLVHVSTDYVFDGTKGEPYLEDDVCRPINVYGESKRKGEEALAETLERHLLIRTAWLYGRGGKNFVKAILAKVKDEGTLRVVDDQVGSPTFTLDLAQATKLLLKLDCTGTYHVTNRGVCSWYEFARRILEYAQVAGVTVVPIKSGELNRKAARPAYSVLSNRKFMEATKKAMRPWQVALNDCLSQMRAKG